MKQVEMDGRQAWSIAFLLFLAQVINYFDKSVIGLAADPIMRELGLTPAQYGFVASSFFSLYAVSGILTGFFLSHRVRSKTLLTILVLIWSASQIPVLFYSSLSVLVMSRVVLGIGEGPANPTAISACHEWFTAKNRNMPTALLMLGSSVGALLAGPILSYAMIAHGWRAAFLICSLLGLVWVVLWQIFGADGPGAAAAKLARAQLREPSAAKTSAAPQSKVWSDPTIIASIVVGFCAYWIAGFMVAWLAPLARNGLGFDAEATGWIVSAVSGAGSVTLLSVSYLSQRMLDRNVTSRKARGVVNAACMLGAGAAFAAAAFIPDPAVKLCLIALGGALPVVTFTLGPAIVSEVSPDAYRARMLTVIYAGITLAGFVSPIAAGGMIGADPDGYDHALLTNAIVALIGGVTALAFLQPERTLERFAANQPPKVPA